MIHLLYQYAQRIGDGSHRVLTEGELTNAGVHCDPELSPDLGGRRRRDTDR